MQFSLSSQRFKSIHRQKSVEGLAESSLPTLVILGKDYEKQQVIRSSFVSYVIEGYHGFVIASFLSQMKG
jgi:hypothetical protein